MTDFVDYIPADAVKASYNDEINSILTNIYGWYFAEGSLGDSLEHYDGTKNNDIDIPPIIISSHPQPLFRIAEFDYSQELYSFLFKQIEKTLMSTECLQINYQAEQGRWLCVYGTIPIERKLSPAQMDVYHRKKSLFNYEFGHYSESKKNTFETIHLTNILKLPFNCFVKAGINNKMRASLRSEIHSKAKQMFPHLATSQTCWFDMYTFNEEDFEALKGKKMWSKLEVVLRKNIVTNKIDIYFNRISGDRCSSSFVLFKIRDCLDLAPTDFIWSIRKNYLEFVEGLQNIKYYYNHIEKYLLNDLLCREICTYTL